MDNIVGDGHVIPISSLGDIMEGAVQYNRIPWAEKSRCWNFPTQPSLPSQKAFEVLREVSSQWPSSPSYLNKRLYDFNLCNHIFHCNFCAETLSTCTGTFYVDMMNAWVNCLQSLVSERSNELGISDHQAMSNRQMEDLVVKSLSGQQELFNRMKWMEKHCADAYPELGTYIAVYQSAYTSTEFYVEASWGAPVRDDHPLVAGGLFQAPIKSHERNENVDDYEPQISAYFDCVDHDAQQQEYVLE